MITAILLIVVPGFGWDRIASARRSVLFIALFFLLPLLGLASFGEGYAMVHHGVTQVGYEHLRKFTVNEAVVFEVIQTLLSLGIIFLCSAIVKTLGETFHGRHTYHQAFTAVAYGMSPLFLSRFGVMIPGLLPWIPWIAGIALSVGALYIGIPRIMQPDPPHAFGLYVMSSLLLFFVTGLLEMLMATYLLGASKPIDGLISGMAKHLPF